MRASLFITIAVFATLLACSSDNKNTGASSSSGANADDGGGGGGGIPDPSVLFDPLPAASPDKLRGVWETKDTVDGVAIATRLRFTDDFVAGNARCTSPAGKSLDAPNIAGIETTDLDKKDGTVAMPGGIAFAATEGDFKCTTSLPGGNLKFAITGTALALSLEGKDGSIAFTKVGD